MRKGRSQRKTRGSLPPLTTRPQQALGAGPQVVIGLTSPPRSDERSEDSSFEDVAETRSAREAERFRAPAVPSAEGTEAARLELVREKSLEIVRESLELVRESLATEQAQNEDAQNETDSDAESESAGVETETAPVASAEASFELVESVPPPVFHAASLPTPDEISIPPMGDLAVEPVAEHFFSQGELPLTDDEPEPWDPANKAIRKSAPEVVLRRARFAKYVRWAVGGAAVVCLAALARTAIVGRHGTSAPAVAVVAEAPPASKAASAGVVPAATAKATEPVAPAAVAPPPAPEARAEAPRVDVPQAAPAPEPARAEPANAAPAKPAVATSDKTALEEKKDARRALERGKTELAIECGERSVALDPTDGEAWLLLGAAYQDKGKRADARRCYASCLKEGKRGPLGECRAMIR